MNRTVYLSLALSGLLAAGSVLLAGFSQQGRAEEVETLKAKAEWTVDQARVQAMKNVETITDLTDFRGMDPNLFENLKALENASLRVANRQLTYFDGGFYAVAFDGEDQVHYYQPNGTLVKVSVCSEPFGPQSKYPRRCIDYAYPDGKFVAVSLDVNPEESFVFSSKGTLLQHWKGEHGYDAEGKPQFERFGH